MYPPTYTRGSHYRCNVRPQTLQKQTTPISAGACRVWCCPTAKPRITCTADGMAFAVAAAQGATAKLTDARLTCIHKQVLRTTAFTSKGPIVAMHCDNVHHLYTHTSFNAHPCLVARALRAKNKSLVLAPRPSLSLSLARARAFRISLFLALSLLFPLSLSLALLDARLRRPGRKVAALLAGIGTYTLPRYGIAA